MKSSLFLSMFVSGVMFLSSIAAAEVQVHVDQLTVQMDNVSLEQVLHSLAKKGRFSWSALEETDLTNETITAEFQGLPMQQGLDRLLNEWNFGLTKDSRTGQIQHLYLVSKRLPPSALPQEPVTPQPESRSNIAHVSRETEDESHNEFDGEYQGFEEGIDSDESSEDSLQEFDENSIPPDLPLEVREAFLKDMAESRQGQ